MVEATGSLPYTAEVPPAASERTISRRRAIIQYGVVILVQVAVLLTMSGLLAGLSIGSPLEALTTTVFLVGTMGVVYPVIHLLARAVWSWLFPILYFIFAGLFVLTTSQWLPGLDVETLWSGIAVALSLTVGSTLAEALFAFDDDGVYYRNVIRPLIWNHGRRERSATPGILFLEIDGLAEPLLREAIAKGYAPNLAAWLEAGSHRLSGWETDLSSQSSASQAGILLGKNDDVPAFRWYDKQAQRIYSSSRLDVTEMLERMLGTEDGLLSPDGASRANVFSGGAPDTLLTSSTVGQRRGDPSYLFYFANTYHMARVGTLFVIEVFREVYQALLQKLRDQRPRISRGGFYPFARAATLVLLELTVYMLIRDMIRGIPYVYATFFGYDEVAHHSGPRSKDAFETLRRIDHEIGRLARARTVAVRPYEIVVLSDHGQSSGTPFRQKYGESLEDLVRSAVAARYRVLGLHEPDESWDRTNLLLNDALRKDSRTARLLRLSLQRRMVNDEVVLGPEGRPEHRALEEQTAKQHNVIVLGSGNLGLISFPDWPERMSYEQIVENFPNLLPTLVNHPGIQLVAVRSETDGGLIIGRGGIHYLNDDHVVGEDPLASYGPSAADHFRRANRFTNAPDILVLSRVDPQTGEVPAFEELVGSHGGLGGAQNQPFVLFPVNFPWPASPVVGAASLHRILKSWITMTVQPLAEPAPPSLPPPRSNDLPVASLSAPRSTAAHEVMVAPGFEYPQSPAGDPIQFVHPDVHRPSADPACGECSPPA